VTERTTKAEAPDVAVPIEAQEVAIFKVLRQLNVREKR